MKSVKGKQFDKLFKQLPRQVQDQAREAYKIFQDNPYDRRIEFKRVHPSRPIYSVRIGYRYRALGVMNDDTVVWHWVGSHEAYNNLT